MAVALTDRLDFSGDELIHLLRRSADELPPVEYRVEIHPGQQWVGAQAIEQIVFIRAEPSCRRDGLAMATNALVHLLAIPAVRHGGHEDVLGGHVRKNLGHTTIDYFGINDQPIAEVQS